MWLRAAHGASHEFALKPRLRDHVDCCPLAGKASSYKFLFDGCPRGGLAQRSKNNGDMSLAKCKALCDSQKDCNIIEINGCLKDRANCGKNCYTFYGTGKDVYNGKCVTNGDQKSYKKQICQSFCSSHSTTPPPFAAV